MFSYSKENIFTYINEHTQIITDKSINEYLKSNNIKSINYEENDIARIIKLSDDTYHIEIISKKLQEYKLWSKICNQKFKSSQRKYGMM